MFVKAIAIFALVGICMAEEHHAYSSQSIVLHTSHGHEGHREYEHEHHHEPVLVHHAPIVVAHHEPVVVAHHEPVVAHHEPIHVVPVAHYVQASSGHEEHHHEHKPAVSYYNIERHDVPAHPPKDYQQYNGPAEYEFAYEVHDPHTGDFKQQHESRHGHVVEGVYSLKEHDGSIRTVKYHADKKTGFNAEVSHSTKHVEEHKHH